MRYAFLRDRSSFRGHASRRPRAKSPTATCRRHKRHFLHYTRKTRTAPGTAQNAKKNRWEMEHRKTHPGNRAHGLFAGSTSRATEAALRLCCLPTRATRVSPSRRKKWLEYAHSAHFSIPHPYRIRPRFAFARTQRRFGSDPLAAGHCRTRGGPFRKRPYHGLFSRLI